jgi:hypothetical protein
VSHAASGTSHASCVTGLLTAVLRTAMLPQSPIGLRVPYFERLHPSGLGKSWLRYLLRASSHSCKVASKRRHGPA